MQHVPAGHLTLSLESSEMEIRTKEGNKTTVSSKIHVAMFLTRDKVHGVNHIGAKA